MNKFIKFIPAGLLILNTGLFAQSPGKWGFGINLGDPTGLTIKHFTGRYTALNFTVGSSYFGEIRIGTDYLWHFDAFRSNVVNMHAGIGGVIGFGNSHSVIFHDEPNKFYFREDDVGIGVRGVVGIDVYPTTAPFEIFLEFGPLVGIVPEAGAAIDVAVGFRVYP